MCCHGELARIKPGPDDLTRFYLFVSIGGALGGIFVALIAPLVFNDYYEYQAGLMVAIGCCLVAYRMQQKRSPGEPEVVPTRLARIGNGLIYVMSLGAMLACGTSWFLTWRENSASEILEKSRNAYGTLKVVDESYRIKLTNGATSHGMQFKEEDKKYARSSYYGPTSGLGRAIAWLRQRTSVAPNEPSGESQSIDFAAIGLGVGTVTSWCEPSDSMRVFEINPDVERVAREYFSYLEHCAVEPDVVLGDARMQLERELNGDREQYDLLIADAFSSDSVPTHLLTIEAFEIYQKRLKPHGILAIHVSNRFLRLDKVVQSVAKRAGLNSIRVADTPKEDKLYYSTTWVLVCGDVGFADYLKKHGS